MKLYFLHHVCSVSVVCAEALWSLQENKTKQGKCGMWLYRFATKSKNWFCVYFLHFLLKYDLLMNAKILCSRITYHITSLKFPILERSTPNLNSMYNQKHFPEKNGELCTCTRKCGFTFWCYKMCLREMNKTIVAIRIKSSHGAPLLFKNTHL